MPNIANPFVRAQARHLDFGRVMRRGGDLSEFSQAELDTIARKLNTRPRKSPGSKCPALLFTPDAFDFRRHHAALFAPGAGAVQYFLEIGAGYAGRVRGDSHGRALRHDASAAFAAFRP